MNEHDFFKQMIHDRAVDDALVKAKAKQKTHSTLVWKKTAAIAAASLAVLIGTVFLIPSARAEVLSWFGVTRPQDYLTANPDERGENPALDAMVASPEPGDGIQIIPIDRTGSNAVNSEGALKVSAFLHENCDIVLGDAMFDGEAFYQTVRFNGLSGLYLLESWTAGNQTAVPVDPYAVWGLYENGPDKEYLSGEKTLYERPEGRIFYELKDGKRLGGMLDLTEAFQPYYTSLFEKGLMGNNKPADAQEQIDRLNREYLEQNGLSAVADIRADRNLDAYADADGNLTVDVYYQVDVIEEDRGDGTWVDDTELFLAKLGTITVNIRAYRNVETSTVVPDTAVVWGAETVTVSKTEHDFGAPDDLYADDRDSFSKHRVNTDGLKMVAEGCEMDSLGIRNLAIRISVPEGWTKEEREAFAESLEFAVLINGETGNWYLNGYQYSTEEDGTLLLISREISYVPYDMMKSIKTISLIPCLRSFESIEVHDYDHHSLGILNPDYGETVWSKPGASGWDADDTVTDFPQYAITLNVQ